MKMARARIGADLSLLWRIVASMDRWVQGELEGGRTGFWC